MAMKTLSACIINQNTDEEVLLQQKTGQLVLEACGKATRRSDLTDFFAHALVFLKKNTSCLQCKQIMET